MGSELLSICATEKSEKFDFSEKSQIFRFVYVGTQEGYVEIFKNGEYGNILERIESGFDMVSFLNSFFCFRKSWHF